MAEDDASTAHFQSIAEAATASWFARQASALTSRQSPPIRAGFAQQGINGLSTGGAAAAPDGMPAPTATLMAASAPPGSPAPPSIHTSSAAALDSPATASGSASASASASASTTSTSGRRDGEAQAHGDVSIRSDITAWQSALQSLPAEFANASEPIHPLAQALIRQPTLRPVEWNQYRQAGGFVPRTSHDYSSLMIYISGQVNPNPCRNCLLSNGPFARCVVSPPAVLAISTIRHACANCTYQNQYKKCTNEPITEQEKARSEWARSVTRTKSLLFKPRKPKTNSRLRREKRREEARHQLERERRYQQEDLRQKHQLEEGGHVSIAQSLAGLGAAQGANFKSFDEKLRYIRACSPRSRRQMAAEMLQWQAAIATVEAEEPVPAPDIPSSSQVAGPLLNHHLPALANSYPSSHPVMASSAPAAAPAFSVDSSVRTGTTGYGNDTFEAMDEDESEDEQEDDDEGTSWVGPDHIGSLIKAPR
ncbi:hypothetical protein F4823DRAFT_513112 [Ustulina deusta]|nr:hypothetical protein F4823DRAFT_513112 [Ustulina deusta]